MSQRRWLVKDKELIKNGRVALVNCLMTDKDGDIGGQLEGTSL